jgi:hypothetical protein
MSRDKERGGHGRGGARARKAIRVVQLVEEGEEDEETVLRMFKNGILENPDWCVDWAQRGIGPPY